MLLGLEGQSIGKVFFNERMNSIVLDDKVLNMYVLVIVTGLGCMIKVVGWLTPYALSQNGKHNQIAECIEIYHSLKTLFFFLLI